MPIHHRSHWLAAIAMAICVLAAYLAYWPAQGGTFLFDDTVNLKGLADVASFEDAKAFLRTGQASSLGRPLALASFLLQKPSWPDVPGDFIRANILIHLVNGLLLFMVAYRVGLSVRMTDNRALALGVAAAGIWMLHPLMASASLLIIQRMTTLAAMFTFLGLWLHFLTRSLWRTHSRRAAVLGGVILGGCTLLATACKENGALLPAFCLLLETLLVRDPNLLKTPLFRRWLGVVCIMPLLTLAAYLVWQMPAFLASYSHRNFSLGERLATEVLIHLDYLKWLLIPSNAALGPFHDDYPVVRTPWQDIGFWLGFGVWAGMVWMAWRLRWRSTLPLFAIAWFFVGHVLEGTFVPLELVFEHRNYVPAVGPILAASFAIVAATPSRLAKAVGGLVTLYFLVLGVVLHQVASTWGAPAVAAQVWFERHPDSERATQFLAGSLARSGRGEEALKLLDDQGRRYPYHLSHSFQALYAGCFLGHRDEVEAIHDRLQADIPRGDFSYGVMDTLRQLLWLLQDKPCPGLSLADLLELSRMVEANPKYRSSWALLLEIQAEILAADGRLDDAVFLARGALDKAVAASLLERLISLELQYGRVTDAVGDIEHYRPGLRGATGEVLARRLEDFRSEILRAGAGIGNRP